MKNEFLYQCYTERQRLGRPGVVQLAGFALHQCEALSPRIDSTWHARGRERALLGWMLEGTTKGCGTWEEAQDLDRQYVWRAGAKARRLSDLTVDLIEGNRDRYWFQGISPGEHAAAIEARHIHALDELLGKPAQRQNLSRLFALSDRLWALFGSSEAVACLQEMDEELSGRWGVAKLLTWSICSRFMPLRFRRKLGGTRVTVAAIYMGEREHKAYASCDGKEALVQRVALVRCLRRLNEVMGWTDLSDAFPERLVMTQRDLKTQRDHDDDDKGDPMFVAISKLAGRSVPQPGDDVLWHAISQDPKLYRHYTSVRARLEEAAERDLFEDFQSSGALVPDTAPRAVSAPWWTRVRQGIGRRWLVAATVSVAALAFASTLITDDPISTPSPYFVHATYRSFDMIHATKSQGLVVLTTTAGLLFSSFLPEQELHAQTPNPYMKKSPLPPKKKKEESKSSNAISARKLAVSINSGDVKIRPHAKSTIEYQVKLVQGSPTTCFVSQSKSGGTLQLTQEQKGGSRCELKLTVQVPQAIDLELEINSGAATVAGVEGKIDLEINSGTARMTKVRSKQVSASINSGMLSMRAAKVDRLDVDIQSGKAEFSGVVKNADVEVSSGVAQFNLTAIPSRGELSVEVNSGTARISVPQGSQVNANLSSTIGSVNSSVKHSPDAPFSINATANVGSIQVGYK